uniref:Uncharacterized protein n=1 Tax=Rhizophora mucronata TaxID=61149 RepID=A0A2P2JI60_RHIMU
MVKICLRPTDASTVEWKRHFEHMQSVPIFLGEVPVAQVTSSVTRVQSHITIYNQKDKQTTI